VRSTPGKVVAGAPHPDHVSDPRRFQEKQKKITVTEGAPRPRRRRSIYYSAQLIPSLTADIRRSGPTFERPPDKVLAFSTP